MGSGTSGGPSTLRPTYSHSRASRYRRPGGPWDRGGLDSSFTGSPGASRASVVDDRGRHDARAVEAIVGELASGLLAAGVRKGDAVSWQLPNGVCAFALYRACWRVGAVAAPLHHRLGTGEVGAALAQVSPRLVVSSRSLPASEEEGALLLEGPGSVAELLDLLPGAAGGPPAAREAEVEGSDLAVALFTSGSTGVPKAVLHTHRGLGYKAFEMVEVHGLGSGDAVLMPAPLAHVSGLLNGVLLPSAAGIPSVLMASWDPERALGHIEAEHVSFMGAPPIFFSQMADEGSFSRSRVASMRLISTGGASVSPAFVEATADAFGCRVKRTYGSTEAPTVTTSGPSDDPQKARHTDGRALGEAELEIHHPDGGELLPTGTPGEIWLRGPELFVGYADRTATEQVISDRGGWYRSGDIGSLDEAGWLEVSGRLSDIVIRAGENISSSEVEAVLEAHPAVRHAVAVGIPDAKLGEKLAALVETDAAFDLEACRSWFAERGVTKFKTPEVVVSVDELPLLASGKPDRAALRKLASDAAHRAHP